MKNPVNIAKKGYNKILQIDSLVERLDNINFRQNSIETEIKKINSSLNALDELQKENNFLKELLFANFHVENAPIANGYLRLSQLANLELLKLFKDICKKHNLEFYLNFGSLLGAIRHHGFVPWDDDVDVMMIREDYNKLLPILDKEFNNTKLFYVHSEIIRIYYGKTPLQLDIFPSDFYYRPMEDEKDRIKTGAFLKEIHQNNIKFDWDKLKTQERTITNLSYGEIEKLREKVGPNITKKEATKTHPAIYHGLEKSSIRKVRSVQDYDWIYPLKTAIFENIPMPIPNQPENLLDYYYGDYMAWPSKIYPKHDDIQSRFNLDNIRILRNVVSGKTNLLEKNK